jgi:two-component system response regulator AtoC
MPTHAKRVLLLDTHAGRGPVRAALVGSGFDVVTAGSPGEVEEILRGRYQADLLVVGGVAADELSDVIAGARRTRAALPIVLIDDDQGVGIADETCIAVVTRSGLADELDLAVAGLLAAQPETDDGFVATSAAMRAVRQLIRQVADTDVPVLVTGDSGVGKEVVARALHSESARAAMPFVKVNCAALPDQLLESELFGYERGAFTGAERDKPGKFELANDGTIFLDEIGEMPEGTQAKLLQVLQDGCYYRLGGNGEVRVNARVVASTNVNLEQAMEAGKFRKDLFYRLNVVHIEVPALRLRRDEIPLLVEAFRDRYEREYGREAGELSPQHLATLAEHDWPGNVRELENLVRRMVVLQDVDGPLTELGAGGARIVDTSTLLGPNDAIPPLKDVSKLAAMEAEGVLIRRALERTGWNRREAADLLQISYKALLYKIRDCGIQAA